MAVRHRTIVFIVDLVILIISFLIMAVWKPATPNYLSLRYILGLGILLVSWILFSLYFKKYTLKQKYTLGRILRRLLLSNLAALSSIAVFMVFFTITGYSRTILFGTVGFATLMEVLSAYLYFYLIHTRDEATDLFNPIPPEEVFDPSAQPVAFHEMVASGEMVLEAVTNECGPNAAKFLKSYTNFDDPRVLVISTTTLFNVQFQPNNYFRQVINLKRVNDIQYINKFFETVNRKLPVGGVFIGTGETKEQRKKRIYRKYSPVLNRIIYFFDFVVKRVFPKFALTKKIYFLLTRGQNRVVSRAEILGRLYSCGFKVVEEKNIDNMFYFVVSKTCEPAYDMNPTYGPFVKLQRIGREGALIKVYKLRTMHPYAEYLQEYVYELQNLQDGGKFRNDFRISGFGKIMRALWLDELPMIFNLFKGQLKIVGVRPLSRQYFDLYSEELKALRIKYKPGLVPPFYADLPVTLEEIQESEMKYLIAYARQPFRTDWVYFWRAFGNIVFRKARSN